MYQNEKTILILRKHRLYYVKHFLVLIILIAIPIILYLLSNYFFTNLFENQGLNLIFILITSLYYCFVLLFSFISWLNYYLDVWVITNYRIIEYEQKSIFDRETSELNIKSIQDITAQVKGILPSIFHFGNLYVQTAGAQERFIFKDVPYPDKAKETIMNLQNQIASQINNQSPIINK